MNNGFREPDDSTCALCPEKIPKHQAICEPCRKLHSPTNPFSDWGPEEGVVFFGNTGSGSDVMMIIRSSDDFYDTGYGQGKG